MGIPSATSDTSMSDSQQAGLIANDHVGSGPDYQQYKGPEATPAPYGAPQYGAPQNQDSQIGFRDLANAIVDLGSLICLLISYGITVALDDPFMKEGRGISNVDYSTYSLIDERLAKAFTWQYMVVAVSAIVNILQSFNLTTDLATWVTPLAVWSPVSSLFIFIQLGNACRLVNKFCSQDGTSCADNHAELNSAAAFSFFMIVTTVASLGLRLWGGPTAPTA